MTAQPTYAELHEFAYSLAEKAVELIRKGSADRWAQAADVEQKKNSVDLVTVTDQAVEDMIKEAVQDRYPSHKFIGEESWEAGERSALTDEFTWIVDPIDGTMNPFVGCSIGVTHMSRPVVGVIAQPFLNRMFSGYAGGGAHMNRTVPLPLTGGVPQPLTELRQCMIASGWGSFRDGKIVRTRAANFIKLIGDPSKGVEGGVMAHSIQTLGSTVCSMAAVIAGEFDVYWDSCWAWDVCAGACILNEMGGFFTGNHDAFRNDAPIGEYLFGRRYACIRAVPRTADESSEQIQRRIIGELYNVVEEWGIPDA